MSSISEYMRDPEVSKVDLLCDKPMRYAIRFDDGSAMLVDGDGKRIESPLSRYDVITDVQFIGRANGVPHFAFEGRDWATRHTSETGMFDSEGHQKLFRDPRNAGLDGVDYIKWEFERMEKLSNDKSNPRRNDPFLVDIDTPQQYMRMGR
ncbi:MAG: hypothetical protein IKZ60_08815 [Bacteroidales bacterium]|nr:hypothetical protein [Bacteroidales bacterium]MBR5925553.1 hypothetical protein [Bacteroidales bacterium]